MNTAHISATISTQTKISVENYLKKTGLKKSVLIETALLHYLQAFKEIPQDVIIQTQIHVSPNTLQQLSNLLENPPEPNEALKNLMQQA
jgi:antitoxin component of RelBE/YafQ-DinJ toxin-antitoxin module